MINPEPPRGLKGCSCKHICLWLRLTVDYPGHVINQQILCNKHSRLGSIYNMSRPEPQTMKTHCIFSQTELECIQFMCWARNYENLD